MGGEKKRKTQSENRLSTKKSKLMITSREGGRRCVKQMMAIEITVITMSTKCCVDLLSHYIISG